MVKVSCEDDMLLLKRGIEAVIQMYMVSFCEVWQQS